jgi:hypothetical protein
MNVYTYYRTSPISTAFLLEMIIEVFVSYLNVFKERLSRKLSMAMDQRETRNQPT